MVKHCDGNSNTSITYTISPFASTFTTEVYFYALSHAIVLDTYVVDKWIFFLKFYCKHLEMQNVLVPGIKFQLKFIGPADSKHGYHRIPIYKTPLNTVQALIYQHLANILFLADNLKLGRKEISNIMDHKAHVKSEGTPLPSTMFNNIKKILIHRAIQIHVHNGNSE